MSVGSGFIAARTTTSSPFVTPPSSPPAWFVLRPKPGKISSCASEPRRPARSAPSPISTALTAWMPISPPASRAVEALLGRRVGAEAGQHARARTSTTPPSVSRSPRASSTARAALVVGLAADRATVLSTRSPSCASSAFATAPAATRTAVERALARSRTLRTSSWPYFIDAGEVGVAGPRQRDRLRPLALRLALGRPRAHPPRPVRVVAVADDERERRAERAAVAQAGEHLDRVGLDLLPRAAAVALPGGARGRGRSPRGRARARRAAR